MGGNKANCFYSAFVQKILQTNYIDVEIFDTKRALENGALI